MFLEAHKPPHQQAYDLCQVEAIHYYSTVEFVQLTENFKPFSARKACSSETEKEVKKKVWTTNPVVFGYSMSTNDYSELSFFVHIEVEAKLANSYPLSGSVLFKASEILVSMRPALVFLQ